MTAAKEPRTPTWVFAAVAGSMTLLLSLIATWPATPDTGTAASSHLSCPQIISHKGAGDLAPENTVGGIHLGHDAQQATIIELDIRYNKSNFAWALHNDDLAPSTTGTGSIRDKWMPDMGSYSAADYPPWNADPDWAGYLPDGSPRTRIPYSYQFLAAARQEGVKLLLDAKVTPTKVQADSLVDDYMDRPELDMRDQVYWMANTIEGLTTMRAWYPDLEYWLIDTPTTGQVGRTGELLQQIGATTLIVPYQHITPALVAYYHTYGIQVGMWATTWAGADTPTTWTAMRAAGIDYLITDHAAQATADQAADCTPPSDPSGTP